MTWWSFLTAASPRRPVRHDREKVDTHSAFRRSVQWLNEGRPIPRAQARAALQSRMKVYQTCADATDLITEIQEALTGIPAGGGAPLFRSDLRARLIAEAKAEITSGRMDSYGFEQLVETILRSLGASDLRIVPRSMDKGSRPGRDLLARQHVPLPASGPGQALPVRPAGGCASGRSACDGHGGGAGEPRLDRHVGLVLGRRPGKQEIEEERGIQIELIDGDQLAAMIVEGRLRATGFAEAAPQA